MQQRVGQTGDPKLLAEAERGAEGQGEGRRIDVVRGHFARHQILLGAVFPGSSRRSAGYAC